MPEQPAAECNRRPDGLEAIGRQLLRNEADARTRRTKILLDVEPVDRDLAVVAVTMPQMMLMSVVLPAPFGPRSAKISPRLMSRSIGFSACRPEA